MNLKSLAKSGLLTAVSAITGRHVVLLPREAADEESLLSLSAPYRVEGDSVAVRLREAEPGDLRITLLAYEGHFPTKRLWSETVSYERPSSLTLDLRSGEVRLGDEPLGSAPIPIPSRRFAWRLELDTSRGTKRRLTGHYLVANGDASYYQGDNYVDYEAEAKGDVPQVLELVQRHGARSPLLEIGCATGLMLEALGSRGFEAYGIDSSSWAVENARKRLGEGRVFLGNPESDGLPESLASRGPFATLLLWAVLEHFHEPFRVLRELTRHAAPGAVLLVNTTNARSLGRLLFGRDWEGYFDASHHGVDAVSVESLREELPRIGWRLELLETHRSWDSSADPTRAAIREWWAADARFRRLLAELDRGDLVTTVAVKE